MGFVSSMHVYMSASGTKGFHQIPRETTAIDINIAKNRDMSQVQELTKRIPSAVYAFQQTSTRFFSERLLTLIPLAQSLVNRKLREIKV